MRRLLLAVAALLVLASSATAHPLGNFTVNHETTVEASGRALEVRYILDMAEIPTIRERERVTADGGTDAYAKRRAAEITNELDLTIDGRRLTLAPTASSAEFLSGAGGLSVLRLEASYSVAGAPASGSHAVAIGDRTYDGRLGWKDVVVRVSGDARIADSSAPDSSVSQGLRRYPAGLTANPSDVREATFTWTPGSDAPTTSASTGASGDAAPERGRPPGALGRFFDGDLSLGVALLALLTALGWGALHAVSPGHGKTMVAAYLVGSRGTPRHALMLGAFVTITHTLGVFALGAVALLLSEYILPETLYPWLNLVAAAMVVLVGLTLFNGRWKSFRQARSNERAHATTHEHGHDHDHAHPHDHPHPHDHDHHHHDGPGGHTHGPPNELSPRRLFAAAAAVGIVPCPAALVMMLGAISVHRIGLGIALVLTFSLGLAGVLSILGLIIVSGRNLFARLPMIKRPSFLALPVASALVIVAVGGLLVARAIPPLR